MKLVNPSKRPLAIALIGMPRSGSTIVASFLNSLDGGFIVGEPHSMVLAPRPFGHDWPAMIDTQFGLFRLFPMSDIDVLDQIKNYALAHDCPIYGYKEVCTVDTHPAHIADVYKDRLTDVFVLVRNPRKVFSSMKSRTPDGSLPTDPVTFYVWYKSLFDFCEAEHDFNVHVISYEQFIKNPVDHLHIASGWEFEGEANFVKFPGGGDFEGRGSTKVRNYDIGKEHVKSDINGTVNIYLEFLDKHKHLK